MSFTGQLGTADSLLGGFELGAVAAPGGFQTANNTLTFTQRVTFELDTHVSNSLTFVQTADAVTTRLDGQNTLVFAQVVAVRHAYTENVNQSLTLTQALASNLHPENVSQTLTFTQVEFVSPHVQSVADTLTLVQVANVDHPIHQSQSITLTDSAVRSIFESANQSLTLTPSAVEVKVANRTVTQALSLVQTPIGNTVRNLAVSQTLTFADSFQQPLPLVSQQFSGQPTFPFALTVPAAQYTIVNARKCVFVLEAPGQSILLRCPIFGDTEAIAATVNVKKTMTGDTYAYVRGNNGVRKLKYSFQIGRQKSLQLKDFLNAHGSEVLKLTNHKGEVWYVNVTTSPYEFDIAARYVREEERVDVTLEFAGIKALGSSSNC